MNWRQGSVVVVGGALMFIMGVYWGREKSGRREEDATAKLRALPTVEREESVVGKSKVRPSEQERRESEVLGKIREMKKLPEGERLGRLLPVLESTTALPLSSGLMKEFEALLKEGDLELSGYLISLMEQREERASVKFLLEAARHTDAEIAERGKFGLEAVAGQVFLDVDEAQKWADSWVPDPERDRLFSPDGTAGDGGDGGRAPLERARGASPVGERETP